MAWSIGSLSSPVATPCSSAPGASFEIGPSSDRHAPVDVALRVEPSAMTYTRSPRNASTCAHCGHGEAAVALGLGTRVLLRCARCGLVRLDPAPTPEELSAVYDSGRYYTTEPASPRTGVGAAVQDAVLRTFWRYPPALPAPIAALAAVLLRPLRNRFLPVRWPGADPVLDIGCGNGQRLLELERHGCTALTGLEPTVGAAHQARNATRADIRTATLETADLPHGHFALVILNQVLEHVMAPRDTLMAIHAHLRPNGTLYLTVPNFGSAEARFFGPAWAGLQLPEHLHHFTEASLRSIVEQAGFRIQMLRTDSVWSVTRTTLKTWRESRPAGWKGLLAALPAQAWLPVSLLADVFGHGQMLRLVATKADR
jgi:SAM-dependent methyltransferase